VTVLYKSCKRYATGTRAGTGTDGLALGLGGRASASACVGADRAAGDEVYGTLTARTGALPV